MSQAWERAAAAYLARRGEDDAVVRYGNIAPDEDALGLLGDLAGRRVLDVGCGRGHTPAACPRRPPPPPAPPAPPPPPPPPPPGGAP